MSELDPMSKFQQHVSEIREKKSIELGYPVWFDLGAGWIPRPLTLEEAECAYKNHLLDGLHPEQKKMAVLAILEHRRERKLYIFIAMSIVEFCLMILIGSYSPKYPIFWPISVLSGIYWLHLLCEIQRYDSYCEAVKYSPNLEQLLK